MKIHKFVTCAFTCMVCLSSSLVLANSENTVQLKRLEGTVLVNQGKGFSLAAPGMQLQPGSRVLVMSDGGVSVVFSDTCTIDIAANSIFSLGNTRSCEQLRKQIQTVGPYYAAAIGVEAVGDAKSPGKTRTDAGDAGTGGDAGAAAAGGEPEVVFAGMSMNEIIVVGVGVGAGLAVVVASGGGGNKSNGAISPE